MQRLRLNNTKIFYSVFDYSNYNVTSSPFFALYYYNRRRDF